MQPAGFCCGLHYQFLAVLSLSSLHVSCITNLGKKALLFPFIGEKMEKVKGQVFTSRAISGGKKPTALMLDISGAFSTAKKPQGLSVLRAIPAALQSAWPWHGIMES